MQKDNLRSAVYKSLKKSLPGCEDSKSKASSTTALEPVLYTRKAHQESVPDFLGAKQEEVMAYGENCDLQLLQIRRRAQKLNQVIDSWSKAPNFNGRSDDIAEDLMRGALDLQESLVMLGKLQETSTFMAQARRKQKQNFIDGEVIGFEAMCSRRCEITYQNRMQEPRLSVDGSRLSVDGSSMSCPEELKKVIKDSLHRQNLLSISSDDENTSLNRSPKSPTNGRTKYTSCNRKGKTNTSVALVSQHKKVNLVAKLMGLEEVPSVTAPQIRKEQTTKTTEVSFRKEPERSSSSKLPRPAFDIEMPKARKLQLEEHDHDPKRKTLQKIIDTMQFKGLLKGGQVEDSRVQSILSTTSRYGTNFNMDDKVPPIVIMKPMHLPYFEREEFQKAFLKNLPAPKDIQTTKLTDEKVVPHHEQMVLRRLERKKEQPVKETEMELSNKNRASASAYHRMQRTEAIKGRKKPQEVQEPMLNKRNSTENKNPRALTVLISQVKTTPSVLSKPEKRQVPARSQISTKTSDLQHKKSNLAKFVSRDSVHSAKENKLTKPKPVRESMVVKVEVDNSKFKEDRKAIRPAHVTKQFNRADNSKFIEDRKAIRRAHVTITPTAVSSISADNLSKQTGQDFKTQGKGPGEKDRTSLCEVTPKHCQGERSSASDEEATELAGTKTTNEKSMGIKYGFKWFLLGNQSFSLRAQELFDIRIRLPLDCQIWVTEESAIGDAKLFLDSANELMAYKSYRAELMSHPMLNTNFPSLIAKISLDQLAEEVGNDIEKLKSYSRVEDGCSSGDRLHTRLERDLWCNGMLLNGGWNMGWMNWVSVEDADRVVQDVEKHILFGLIGEVTMDLVY